MPDDFLIPGPGDPLTLRVTEPDGTVITTGYGARSYLTRPGLDILERAAQHAGERRYAFAQEQLYADEAEDPDTYLEGLARDYPGERLAGPFCGCDTCIVREVLDAAWPHLLEAARLEAANEKRPPHHARAVLGGPPG